MGLHTSVIHLSNKKAQKEQVYMSLYDKLFYTHLPNTDVRQNQELDVRDRLPTAAQSSLNNPKFKLKLRLHLQPNETIS